MRSARVRIAGAPVDPLRRVEVEDAIVSAIAAGEKLSVMYLNAHGANLAADDAGFRATLDAAGIVFCDGEGVRLASRVLGRPVPERFTPPDWIHGLLARCASSGYGVFLLGAAPGVAERAAARLARDVPGLSVGAHHGHFDVHAGANERVVRAIDASGARLLLVGMGMPRQETWIAANLPRLATANVAMAVGALFDTLAGDVPRGPQWLTDHGLEWATRLVTEPRRLWKRYLVGNPRFVARVVRARLTRRS